MRCRFLKKPVMALMCCAVMGVILILSIIAVIGIGANSLMGRD